MKGPRPTRDELGRLLEGEVLSSRAAELEAEVRGDAGVRAALEAEQALHASLRAVPPELEGVDLVDAVREAAQVPAPPPRRRSVSFAVAAVALAATLAAVVVFSGRLAPDARVKGAASESAERWTGVRVFSVGADGASRPLSDSVHASDGLAFAYLNASATPFTHLLVFGLDARGSVFWYYPAWERAGEDPEAVAIRAGPDVVSLGEKIVQPLTPGPLVVRAVFATRPLRVSEVERLIRELGPERALSAERIPLEGTVQQRVAVEVVP